MIFPAADIEVQDEYGLGWLRGPHAAVNFPRTARIRGINDTAVVPAAQELGGAVGRSVIHHDEIVREVAGGRRDGIQQVANYVDTVIRDNYDIEIRAHA